MKMGHKSFVICLQSVLPTDHFHVWKIALFQGRVTREGEVLGTKLGNAGVYLRGLVYTSFAQIASGSWRLRISRAMPCLLTSTSAASGKEL